MSTYTPITSLTLSSAQSSITFSGIPQVYTDLVIMAVPKTTSANQDFRFYLNGDTGSNYFLTALGGDGSSAASTRTNNEAFGRANWQGYPSTNFNSNLIMNIMSYSNATIEKTVLTRSNNADNGVGLNAIFWRGTSAVTSITLYPSGGGVSWDIGTTFNLYGIDASVSAQAKATGGDSIYTDSSYWYHVFNKSGTFTPSQSLSNVDYLVVAGGGSGGQGGGGAGGLRSTVTATGGGGSLESALTMSSNTSYTVTVGAGGTAPNAWDYPGSQGSNSSISGTGITTVTSTGGGFGTTVETYGAGNGGSGGGEGRDGNGTFGTGTANQGYNGGASQDGGWRGAGGGGGAGAVGGTGTGTGVSGAEVGGTGGTGVAVSITGSSVTYAGGGGGGAEGTGGRGAGGAGGGGQGNLGNDTSNTAGTVNTGGGGGGGSGLKLGKSGGSGIIVLRYPV